MSDFDNDFDFDDADLTLDELDDYIDQAERFDPDGYTDDEIERLFS